MSKLQLFVIFFFIGIAGRAQVVEVTANPGTSATGPFGTSNYAAGEYIYTETELGGATNFVTAGTAITHLAFSINTVGTNTTFNNVNIYLKNIPLATTSFTSGTYTTAGYTLVYSGSVAGSPAGWTEVTLATPFTRIAGNNLQMLIERTDGVTHSGYIYNCAIGNHTATTVNSCRRYNSTTALSGATSLSISTFKAAVKFSHRYNNDARVLQIYTLGKLPLPNGSPHTISASVINDGLTNLPALNVTLNITGANTYTNTKVISINSLASGTVTFDPFTPTVEGTNTVTVSVTSDDYAPGNNPSMTQVVNKNTWSYAYGSTASGGVGFNGATGDFVAKFNTNAATSISQVAVNFSSGGQPYQIGIWQANGAGGTPGTNLWTSASLTAVAGVNTIPVTPALSIPAGDFYVGVKQTGTLNVSFAYQTESPIRPSTFYFTSPGGGTTWTDFAPNNPFRFMIEPKLILPIDAGVSNLSAPSTVTCYSTPQTFTATLVNAGANSIAPGAASVTLKIAGANTFTGTLSNTGTIASGGTEVITFTGVNLSNGGTNFDTLFVNLGSDPEKANDTIKSSFLTAASITALPLDEGFENATLNFGYITLVAGGRNLTTLNTGTYTNVDYGGTLSPHGGTRMIIFDNYSGTNSAGVVNRLYSECITIPASGVGLCDYNLSFWMSHDASFSTFLDSLYISISTNGGATWTRILPGFRRYDATFTTPGWRKETISLAAYAGQKIQIGFEDVSKYGNVIALDDINVGSTAAQNITLSTAGNNGVNLQKGCDDQGWTYYVNPASPNEYLFGIQWDPTSSGANTASKAASIPRIQLDAANYAAEDIPAKKATYTMRRYWNVDLNSTTMTAPVNVRFFYNASEKTATDNAAAAFALAQGAAVEPPLWFKTNAGITFTPGASSVTPIGVNDADSLINVNTANNTINGVLYAQFNGVTSFSGGTYASGVGTGRVLPIRLLSFTGMLNRNNAVELEWQVALQASGTSYNVERSTNGTSFEQIGSVAASTSGNYTYRFTDAFPASVNFYRLRVTEGGRTTYSNVIRINMSANGSVTLYPVPASNEVNLYIQKQALLNTQAQVTGAEGKTVMQFRILRSHETIDISALQTGVYFVRFADGSQVKLVKQ